MTEVVVTEIGSAPQPLTAAVLLASPEYEATK